MKPIELYRRQPEKVTKEIGYLKGFYYDHIPEINEEWEWELWRLDNEKIEIRFYKDHCFDDRRIWRLASVWFDGNPVMIIQNAGREGDDYSRRFITDKNKYIEMIDYIKSLIRTDNEIKDLVDLEQECGELVTFYGYTLDGDFNTL
jgi:hypothetical protein